MIRLEKVNKYFNRHKKNQIHVINDMSIDLPKKGLVALLGPSGCGKTTLLNVIGGLDKVSSGNIYVDGVKITKGSHRKIDKIRNLNIGYIFQDYKLVDNMTVFENVSLSLKLIGLKDKEEIKKRVLYTLEKVNMLRYKNRPVSMLSGGERQRVGIARALVKNPHVIIADEPTGNLDSKNSLEIMNIIKSISSKYLVILVTHEVELAKFYAERVIELLDGRVIKDYQNEYSGNLDYKIENQIYLKDFASHEFIQKDNININIFRDNDEDLDISLIFKNGNIYVESKNKEKVEVVDASSNVEIIDDHYQEIKENNTIIKEFDIERVSDKTHKPKYSSIFKFSELIKYGFQKVFAYPILKKILLAGFFISGMFIFYAASSIFATLNVEDKDFIKINKDYLIGTVSKLKVEDYLALESMDYTSYALPGSSLVTFQIHFDKYLQTYDSTDTFDGSLSSVNSLKKEDIILGSLPTNKSEIVIDKSVITNFIKSKNTKMAGFNTVDDFLNHEVSLNNMTFKIVGFTEKDMPNIYAFNSEFINIIASSIKKDMYGDTMIFGTSSDISDSSEMLVDYLLLESSITLVSGTLPKNDYEVILNTSYEYEGNLNKESNITVNGKKLKIVGYYKGSKSDLNNLYLVNNNTIKYDLISKSNEFVISSTNKSKTIDLLKEKKINIVDSYEHDKNTYLNENKKSMLSTIIVSLVILSISLIEVLLMIRSSFLSRIKEVGIYRAIGVKKSDIYKMFAGEIMAITLLADALGIGLMAYILYNLSKISFMSNMFMVNVGTIGISLILVIAFNLIVGLFPIWNIIRKTPAAILSRFDVD